MSSLEWVAFEACRRFRKMKAHEVEAMLVMVRHEGFRKAALPETFLQDELRRHGLCPKDVQLDVVYVENDVHVHHQLAMAVVCLGPDEHLPKPRQAEIFVAPSWQPIHMDEIVPIRAGTLHGFRVKPGGSLYYLSVRSSPIF